VAFSCPHGGAYTHQDWHSLYAKENKKVPTSDIGIPDYKNLLKEAVRRWLWLTPSGGAILAVRIRIARLGRRSIATAARWG